MTNAGQERVGVLLEALPYIERFRGTTVVVKYGGNAMVDPALGRHVADDVVLLRAVGLRPVVVHGGGPQISELMGRLGKQAEFRDGLRVTDAETVDIARMVLVGKVNREIVSAINVHGPLAVGMSGEDAGLISAEARDAQLGFVGDVAAVNPTILERLLAEDLIPVLSTIGSDADGQPYNINADTVAGAVAVALKAEKAIFLTDVPGLLTDVDDPASLVSAVTTDELAAMVEGGSLQGGMIPKVEACLSAVELGVDVQILDGRARGILLHREGRGTSSTPRRWPAPPPTPPSLLTPARRRGSRTSRPRRPGTPNPEEIANVLDKVLAVFSLGRLPTDPASVLRTLGCPGPNQMKTFLRCGMGPCQGRLCGLTVTELMAAARGLDRSSFGGSFFLHPAIKAPINSSINTIRPIARSSSVIYRNRFFVPIMRPREIHIRR